MISLRVQKAWESYRPSSARGLQTSSNVNVPSACSLIISRMFPNSGINTVDELQSYLSSPAESKDVDVNAYWLSKKSQFPCLSRMALDYMGVLASSASSERVFSTAKLLIGPTRMSLSPQSMESSICLRSWVRVGFISVDTMLEKVCPSSIATDEDDDILQTAIDSSGIFIDLNELENFEPNSPYVDFEIELEFED